MLPRSGAAPRGDSSRDVENARGRRRARRSGGSAGRQVRGAAGGQRGAARAPGPACVAAAEGARAREAGARGRPKLSPGRGAAPLRLRAAPRGPRRSSGRR